MEGLVANSAYMADIEGEIEAKARAYVGSQIVYRSCNGRAEVSRPVEDWSTLDGGAAGGALLHKRSAGRRATGQPELLRDEEAPPARGAGLASG
jgi:hypothetical protein